LNRLAWRPSPQSTGFPSQLRSLQATAGLAAFVGADPDRALRAQDLSVAINRGLHQNFPAIPGASANGQSRLVVADPTRGSVAFAKDGASASASVLADDSDAQVAAKVRTGVESISSIGSSNVTVSGSRVRLRNRIHQHARAANVSGLTVSTNATLSGSIALPSRTARSPGSAEMRSITLTRQPAERPLASASVTEIAAGRAGQGQIVAIRIAPETTRTSGEYTLTLDGSTVHIRWNQSDITNNAEKLRQALVNLTGDSGVYVRFDQKSLILNQRYFVAIRGSALPGVVTGVQRGTVSGTVTIETENPGYWQHRMRCRRWQLMPAQRPGTFPNQHTRQRPGTWTTYCSSTSSVGR
jgi:hypothetical protein